MRKSFKTLELSSRFKTFFEICNVETCSLPWTLKPILYLVFKGSGFEDNQPVRKCHLETAAGVSSCWRGWRRGRGGDGGVNARCFVN